MSCQGFCCPCNKYGLFFLKSFQLPGKRNGHTDLHARPWPGTSCPRVLPTRAVLPTGPLGRNGGGGDDENLGVISENLYLLAAPFHPILSRS